MKSHVLRIDPRDDVLADAGQRGIWLEPSLGPWRVDNVSAQSGGPRYRVPQQMKQRVGLVSAHFCNGTRTLQHNGWRQAGK